MRARTFLGGFACPLGESAERMTRQICWEFWGGEGIGSEEYWLSLESRKIGTLQRDRGGM